MTSPRFSVGDRVEDAVSHRAGIVVHVYDDVNIRAALVSVRLWRKSLADVRITSESGRIADIGGRLKSAKTRHCYC